MKASLIVATSALIASSALLLTATAAEPAKKAAPTAQAAQPAATALAVRDWAEVDTNRDGLVSPEEMERYLAAKPGPLAQR